MKRLFGFFGIAVFLFWNAQSAHADAVPEAYQKISDSFGIPKKIFYAIALTESGLYRRGTFRPWPWSLNVEGEPKRFDTIEEAKIGLEAAQRLNKRTDVGIMQINSYWHQHRVATVYQLLIPELNLTLAATILSEQKQTSRSWWEAVGKYHAPGRDARSQRRAQKYRNQVKKHFNKL